MLPLNDLVPNVYRIRLPELNLRLPGCQPPRMFQLILHLLRRPLCSRESLILENVAVRRVWQGWQDPLVIVQPETVIRWHRRGFRAFTCS